MRAKGAATKEIDKGRGKGKEKKKDKGKEKGPVLLDGDDVQGDTLADQIKHIDAEFNKGQPTECDRCELRELIEEMHENQIGTPQRKWIDGFSAEQICDGIEASMFVGEQVGWAHARLQMLHEAEEARATSYPQTSDGDGNGDGGGDGDGNSHGKGVGGDNGAGSVDDSTLVGFKIGSKNRSRTKRRGSGGGSGSGSGSGGGGGGGGGGGSGTGLGEGLDRL